MTDRPLLHLVVMGVSGTGKSTVGTRVAEVLGLTFVEGDEHHPAANVAKMSAGVPLDDDDRWPWLAELCQVVARLDAQGHATLLTCSALRRSYRDVLRAGVPGGDVFFVHLDVAYDEVLDRMGRRQHFMPPALLASQYDALEPLEPDEPGLTVDASATLEQTVAAVVAAARQHGPQS